MRATLFNTAWQTNIPVNFFGNYQINNTYYIDYNKKLWITVKKDFSIDIQPIKEVSQSLFATIKVFNYSIELSTGAVAAIDILKRTASICNELQLIIGRNGALYNVKNLETIQNKWQELKDDFSVKYKGEIFNNYLQRIDHKISTQETLIKTLCLYEQFGLLLKPIYAKYDDIAPLVINHQVATSGGYKNQEETFRIVDYNDEESTVKINAESHLIKDVFTDYKGVFELNKSGFLKSATIQTVEYLESVNYANSYKIKEI